jgi:hypothetical protein
MVKPFEKLEFRRREPRQRESKVNALFPLNRVGFGSPREPGTLPTNPSESRRKIRKKPVHVEGKELERCR